MSLGERITWLKLLFYLGGDNTPAYAYPARASTLEGLPSTLIIIGSLVCAKNYVTVVDVAVIATTAIAATTTATAAASTTAITADTALLLTILLPLCRCY